MALTPKLLDEAITEYVASRETRGLAHNTVRLDKSVLKQLLAFTGNIQVRSLEDRHIDGFFATKQNLANSSKNLQLQKLRSFFAWAIRRGYIKDDPTQGWRGAKTDQRLRLFVPTERFEELLDATDNPRDRVVVALGLYLFLRGSEISDLKVGDIDLDAGEIDVRIPKTRDRDTMPICEELDAELRRWLRFYAENLDEPLAGDMLLCPAKFDFRNLPSAEGRFTAGGKNRLRFKPRSKLQRPERVAQRALENMGLPSHREGIHTLRRSGARALFNEMREDQGTDGSLHRVKVMLHHKNVSMTEHYLGIEPEREARNSQLKGRRMFRPKRATADNVVEIRRGAVGDTTDDRV